MSDYNGAIRPFVAPNVRPATLQTSVKPEPHSDAVLKFGKAGNSIFAQNAPGPFWSTKTPDPESTETKRTYDVVRVSNVDDPDTYIDTEVMTGWEARTAIDPTRIQIDPSRLKFVFEKTKEADNVKILESGKTRTSTTST